MEIKRKIIRLKVSPPHWCRTMAQTTRKPARFKLPTRFKLPARIRIRRNKSGSLDARMALIDRIADLPGIETVERNEETIPRRVDIYLRRESADRVLRRKAARPLCSLDCTSVTVSGLDRWARYQVMANGWGKLIDDRVRVCLPRDEKELEIVWSVIRRAYDRLFGPSTPEAVALVVATRDRPKFSRTSLQ